MMGYYKSLMILRKKSDPLAFDSMAPENYTIQEDVWDRTLRAGGEICKNWLPPKSENEQLREKIAALETELHELTKVVNSLVGIELRALPEADVRKCISDYISKFKDGDEIYPDDIAFEFGIDPYCVEAIMDKMKEEGAFR